MDELENLGEEKEEERKPEKADATHIDEYGLIINKENFELVKPKISKLLEQGFTVTIRGVKQKDFKLE
jgi:hypothetical protein